MKRLILTAAIAVLSAGVMAQTGGNKKISTGFRSDFPEASNISWTEKKSFVVISFKEYDQPVQAYYDYDGKKMAVSRNVRLNNLTMPALTAVQQKYAGYAFVGGVELDHAEDGHSYYVSMQKDARRVIVRVSMDGNLRVFKTMKVTDINLPAFAKAEDILR
jgi:hypothetical protein